MQNSQNIAYRTAKLAISRDDYYFTREIYAIPLQGDTYLIYAPLRKCAFICNTELVNILVDLQANHDPSDLLCNKHISDFLWRVGLFNTEPEEIPFTTFSGAPQPVMATLFLTNACNLRCAYCYASAGEAPTQHMSFDVAKHGIDFIVNNAIKRGEPAVQLAYHGGGEPTVNWKVMTESLAYAKFEAQKHNLMVRTSTATNGMLNDRQIEWIVTQMDGASLSFDGLPSVNDKFRMTASGHGSSQYIENTMRKFDDAGFTYGLRMTVTSEQIAALPDSVEYVCSRYHPVRIQVEPAYQMGTWCNAASSETDDFIAAYREAQRLAKKYEKEINFSAARVGILTNHFCGVSQDNFALSANGNVSACYEVFSENDVFSQEFFYGKPDYIKGGYIFDLGVLNGLRSQVVQNREYCAGCFAKWSCAGDCYNKLLQASDDGRITGSDRCHIIRELSKDQILEKIKDSGGIFWHER
jgi:uncharacterized protein